jgi:hypothetical protein
VPRERIKCVLGLWIKGGYALYPRTEGVSLVLCQAPKFSRVFRLPALFDGYIHPLKRIFHSSHHKIYSFSALIHPLYHPLSTVGPLVTLSKYIQVRSCFEEFIETNLMVQLEFNLVFWFMSYITFFIWKKVRYALPCALSLACTFSLARVLSVCSAAHGKGRPLSRHI